MAAEKVIGQPDFLTGTRGTGQNRLSSPRHIAIDTDDRLYVADAGNNRIAIYDRDHYCIQRSCRRRFHSVA